MSIHAEGANTKRADQNFRHRVEEIAAFRATHERFPSSRAQSTPERILGRWLSSVRTTHRGKAGKGPQVSAARVEILDELIPGWNEVAPGQVADDATFRDHLDQVVTYLAEHGHMPTFSSADGSALARWLSRVKGASKGRGNMAWTPEREKLISEKLPGWLSGGSQ